jgi:hypothetical protein
VRAIVPFLLATMAVLVLLSWRPELVTMALE